MASTLEIQQGVDSIICWDITDSDNQPANLVGYTAQMQVRQQMDPKSTLLHTFHPVCEDSMVVLPIDSEETYLFTWSRGKSTLVLINSSSQPMEIVWSGSVKLLKIATRVDVSDVGQVL